MMKNLRNTVLENKLQNFFHLHVLHLVGFIICCSPKHVVSERRDGYHVHMNLTVRSLALHDYGVYKCISKNSLGSAESTVRIYGEYQNQTKPDRISQARTDNPIGEKRFPYLFQSRNTNRKLVFEKFSN